ncbi:nitroreductase family protein [Reinekea sp.]|uniref:nitroreductase family protein n=1 Tax=Reinekea sp. TaxID=1970455 RepID=UPI002A82CB33|nr:nitroreductase family protein [Reinekea sp.]
MNSNYQPVPLNYRPYSEEEMIQRSESFYENARRRRSVREFSDKVVPNEVIENALLAAGTAANGANMQPWHFVAITNKELKRVIRLAAEKEEQEFYSGKASEEWLDALAHLGTDAEKPFLETASHLIVIFLKKFSYEQDGTKLKNYYTAESVGIATGVLIDALHHSGVATLTHTPSPMKFLNEILDRAKDERLFMILVAGYPVEGCTVPDISKKSLKEIATFID